MYENNFTPKERILRSISGKETDRLAWSPFLAYYWDFLPHSIQKKGELAYLQEMGADPLLRGTFNLYTLKYKNCNIRTSQSGNRKSIIYETPVGSLTEGYIFSEAANSWFLTSHPVQSEEDFKTLQYLFEHASLQEQYQSFSEHYRLVGEQGLIVPGIGAPYKTPFQSMLEHWCGTVDLVYALYDSPEPVEECLSVMEKISVDAAVLCAASEAEAFIFAEDSSTTNISPELFQKYAAPSINSWGDILHKSGKYLIHHACGHIKDLLPLMNETEVDMIESVSPPPTGNIDISGAFSLIGKEKGIIGGIEPAFFQTCSLDELEFRVQELCTLGRSRKYILANSDSCPPAVAYEKFTAVSQWVKKYS